MTEESYQQCRKVMQKANYMRGRITDAKSEVAKWSKIEDSHRSELREEKAEGAKKMLAAAMKKLDERRAEFAALEFPPSNLKKEYVQSHCKQCNTPIAQGNEYCGECMCEDDSYL